MQTNYICCRFWKKIFLGCQILLNTGVLLSQELGPAPIDYGADRVPRTAPAALRALTVNTQDRAAVVQLYYSLYVPTSSVDADWTGSISGCDAGTTSNAYINATLQRINYYRAMVGLSREISFSSSYNSGCQEAALMMSANNSLSHSPPSSWTCYSDDGAFAAGKSNIALGAAGPGAINLYMDDFGSGNSAVGHRRWILYPPQDTLGTGSVAGSGARSANALRVIGGAGTRPALPEYVAWPPVGYIPTNIMPCGSKRWSFSYPSADFSNTTVAMTEEGQSLSINKEPIRNGYGDNTLVWVPQWSCPSNQTADITYEVALTDVRINSVSRNFTYTVIAIDPEQDPSPDTKSPAAPENMQIVNEAE
jgi:hypothetical protein